MPAPGDQHRTPSGIADNPFEEPPKRVREYTAQEIATLQARLDKQLGPEYISARPGPGGQKVHYISAEKCISLANEIFGFNGWSSSIRSIQIDFVDESSNGRISLGLSVIVRVTLRDGTYHEDIGYGHAENSKDKAAAFDKAKKQGTSDALKRALRTFGNVLGNCIYDKDYLAKVTRVKAAPAKWDVENLHRHPSYVTANKDTNPAKKDSGDNGLPPRPTEVNQRGETGNVSSSTFDVDGEFGSDFFDEADFAETTGFNPDEIFLDAEHQQNPSGQPQDRQSNQSTYNQSNTTNTALVTPSRPPVGRPGLEGSAAQRSLPPHQTPVRQPNLPGAVPQAVRLGQDPAKAQTTTTETKRGEMEQTTRNPAPSSSAENATSDKPIDAPVAFFSARAVDALRENPQAASNTAPKFNPHAESPSIRKTAGIDHSKSVPISKPMLSSLSQTPGTNTPHTRDFINPSSDAHRRIGAPSGGKARPGLGTPPYRPLTRPNMGSNNNNNNSNSNNSNQQTNQQGQPAGGTVTSAPQPNGLKRPALSDVTNSPTTGTVATGPGDAKRPRVGNNEPQQPQQQQTSVPQQQ
ncbi:hypothetical protein VTN31DRAFT_802 [Thermomyces dupontii]|uniref:uncharacterized protein n=1 Tax=Talaromyces thermophilus TaxID=28565 RepID=UPI003741EB5B